VCRYHGWSYDASGKAAIPAQEALYRFTERELGRACLRQFAVARAGAFVFVNLSESPPALEAQFDATFLESLRQVSGHFDGALVHASVRARFDWKLAWENVLDPHHVHHLHARTFGPSMPRPAAAPPLPEPFTVRDLSFHQASPFASLKPADWHARVEPYGGERLYHNWFIHPNVNFVSIGGYSFSMHQFVPAGPGE